jgi:hypothetical protein
MPQSGRVPSVGKTVRSNLVRMLKHFKLAKHLGLASANDLWDSGWGDFHATSVVPQAAFSVKRDGSEKLFAGSFDEVRRNDVLRECFEQEFLPTLRAINPNAIWAGPRRETSSQQGGAAWRATRFVRHWAWQGVRDGQTQCLRG